MTFSSKLIEKAVEAFASLPGIGRKTAGSNRVTTTTACIWMALTTQIQAKIAKEFNFMLMISYLVRLTRQNLFDSLVWLTLTTDDVLVALKPLWATVQLPGLMSGEVSML